jgi:hypothetical protein
MNPVTGEAQVDIGGTLYTVRFDWAAIGTVTAAHGDSINWFSPAVVASVAAAGMRRSHPDMTAARIMELSPPLVPFSLAVQQAFQWAYFGNEEVPDDGQKKSPKRTGWWRRFAQRVVTALTRKRSGG